MRSNTPKSSLRRLRRRLCLRAGFTLIEAALTTMIVGVGTVAMLGLLASGTSANQQSAILTTAVNLANNIHELADRLPFADSNPANHWATGVSLPNLLTSANGNVTWLDGQTFSPPVDATNTAIAGMSAWSQVISVHSANSSNITANAGSNDTAANPMSRVTVTINYNGSQVFQTSWLVTR